MRRASDYTTKRKHYYVCFERPVASKGRKAGWSYVEDRNTLDELKKHKHCVDAEVRIVETRKKRVNGNKNEQVLGITETKKIDVPRQQPVENVKDKPRRNKAA